MLYTNNVLHMFEYEQKKVTHNKFFKEKKESNGKKLYNNKIANLVTLLNNYFLAYIFLGNGNSFTTELQYTYVCTLPPIDNKYWFYYFIIFHHVITLYTFCSKRYIYTYSVVTVSKK